EQAVEGGRVRDVRTQDEVARIVCYVGAAAGIHRVEKVAAGRWVVEVVNRRLEDLHDVAIEKIRVSEITGVEPAERRRVASDIFPLARGDILDGIDRPTCQRPFGRHVNEHLRAGRANAV